MKFRSSILPALAIIMLISVAYSRTPANGRVWDDDSYLTDKHLANVDGLKKMWQDPTSTKHPYYPLTRTTFWIENRFWGENLFVSHLTNILLHTLSSLLLWRILRRLKVAGAWVIAAIYGVHPVCVESAAWIAERKNVLAVFFYLASMYSFLKFQPFPDSEASELSDKRFYYFSLFLFLCSLLSKTAFCTLPLALILIFWWKQGKIKKVDLFLVIPFLLLASILGALTIFLEKNHTGAQGSAFNLNFMERCLIAGRALWFYTGKMLFPYQLNFMYPRWEIDTGDLMQYWYVASAAAVIAILWFLRYRIGRGPLVAVLFFIVTLLPAIGFINHYLMRYTFVADHLQYLPVVGILSLTVSAIYKFLSGRLPQSLQTIFWTGILVMLGISTWRQTGVYKDNLTLYNDIISKNSICWMAFNNRGLIYLDQQEPTRAIADFNRAIQLNPNFEEAFLSRGHFYFQQNRYDEALKDFNRALEINPYFDEGYRDRGAVFFVRQRYDLALADFNRALFLNPDFSHAYNARGVVLSVTKHFNLALQDYNRAIQIDPNYGSAYMNRSRMLWEVGNYQSALKDAVTARSLGVPGTDRYIKQLKAEAQTVAPDQLQK